MRVHLLPKGKHIAPMPAMATGDVGRKLQGGMPPVPYRSRNVWCGANRHASEPFASRQIKGEVLGSRKENA